MDTFEKICEVIRNRFEIENINLSEDTTFDEINADSIDLVDLVMELEDEFGIEIKDEAFEDIKTVGNLSALIDSLA